MRNLLLGILVFVLGTWAMIVGPRAHHEGDLWLSFWCGRQGGITERINGELVCDLMGGREWRRRGVGN